MKKLKKSKESVQTRKCYTPQLSEQAIFFLRRLSWQQGKPMTQTLNALVLSATIQLAASGNCSKCNASKEKCSMCKLQSAKIKKAVKTTASFPI